MKYTRTEYPRPQFRRDDWTTLNGEWACCFDEGNAIPKDGAFTQKINVPFTHEYEASGIADGKVHNSVWYRRSFKYEKSFAGKRVLLCFNAADYVTDVWVNGNHAVTHVGGFSPFSADITEYITDGNNELTVHCVDPLDPTIPRGKQSWLFKPFGCWYTPNTGIWQSVWLELFDVDCITDYTATPNIDYKTCFG